MRLEQSFEVAAPLEQVWHTLVDVEHVAPCLPGAAVTGRNDDGSYNGTFTVKIGPTTASYTGRLEMENIDEASHTATMQAQGTDKRGQGGAKATILSRLAPADGQGTRVEVVTDYHITGRLARFGRGGMIEDISARLLREFAKRLQTSLDSQPATRPPPSRRGGAGCGAGPSAEPWRRSRLRRRSRLCAPEEPVAPAVCASEPEPAPCGPDGSGAAPSAPEPAALALSRATSRSHRAPGAAALASRADGAAPSRPAPADSRPRRSRSQPRRRHHPRRQRSRRPPPGRRRNRRTCPSRGPCGRTRTGTRDGRRRGPRAATRGATTTATDRADATA